MLVCNGLGSWLLLAAVLGTLPLGPTPLEAQQEPGPMGIQRLPMMAYPSRTTGCSKYAGTVPVLKDFIVPSAVDVNQR